MDIYTKWNTKVARGALDLLDGDVRGARTADFELPEPLESITQHATPSAATGGESSSSGAVVDQNGHDQASDGGASSAGGRREGSSRELPPPLSGLQRQFNHNLSVALKWRNKASGAHNVPLQC